MLGGRVKRGGKDKEERVEERKVAEEAKEGEVEEDDAATRKGTTTTGLDIAPIGDSTKTQSTIHRGSQSAEQRRQETMQPSRLQSLRSLPRNLIEPNLLVYLSFPLPVEARLDASRILLVLAVVCSCTYTHGQVGA